MTCKPQPGESIVAYLTELRTITKNCQHDNITPDDILRDRIVLRIREDKVRERLLRLNDLTLQKTVVDLIKPAEQTEQQVNFFAARDVCGVHGLVLRSSRLHFHP